MKVVFMGTSDFADPILYKLIQSQHKLLGVYTKSPKASGRKMKMKKSSTHIIAEDCGIEVFTPKTLRTEEAEIALKTLDPDIVVVASYGLIIPGNILSIPKNGFLNVHPSALPRWRGAAPIQRTLMAGDKYTAVCIMQMDEGLDTGPILMREDLDISEDDNSGTLTKLCAEIGGDLLLQVLGLISQGGALKVVQQAEEGMTYAHKIEKSDEQIDWNCDAIENLNKIRGLSPKPGAYFIYNGIRIKILEARLGGEDLRYKGKPGEIVQYSTKNFRIYNGDGFYICPMKLQKEGGKEMDVSSFLNGCNLMRTMD